MKKIVIIFLVLTNISSHSFYSTLKKEKDNFGNCGTFIREAPESVSEALILENSKANRTSQRDHLLREIHHNDAEIANVDPASQNPYKMDYYFFKNTDSKIPDEVLVLSIFKPPKNS